MRRKHIPTWLFMGSCLCAAASCGVVVADPQVDYGDSEPLGRWQPGTAQTRFETEGLTEEDEDVAEANSAGSPAIATAPARASSASPVPVPRGAGSTGSTPASGSAGSAAPSGSSDPGKPQPGSAGAAAPSGGETVPTETETPSGAVSTLEFNYSTESLGGRYSPKNVGAVWVTDSNGKLVKSLELWARTRLRYLLTYATARESARPDVTATATLTSHKAHTASWDLKDSTGASVPAGKYVLHAEVTDSHADGKSISVPFDTSAGAATLKAPDSAGFTGLELVLK
jgi:hypothetical protein